MPLIILVVNSSFSKSSSLKWSFEKEKILKTTEYVAFATHSFSSFPLSSEEVMSVDMQKGTLINESVGPLLINVKQY